MCRLLGTFGRARSLREVLLGQEHSLEVQSYAPKMMNEALLNADGFGVAWYVEGEEGPARYRSVLPIWSDENLRSMGGHVRSERILAYVRSATPGIGVSLPNTQPFVHGPYCFMHNGYLNEFRQGGTMRRIQQGLSDEAFQAIGGTSDSEHLFALTLDALFSGADLLDALKSTVERARTASDGRRGLLAFMLSDGERMVSLRSGIHGAQMPTLFVNEREGVATVASEPLDEGEWEPVPGGASLELHASGVKRSWT
ncbi:MAG: class II glutamine amidotransferase [Myxococcota bacterium]